MGDAVMVSAAEDFSTWKHSERRENQVFISVIVETTGRPRMVIDLLDSETIVNLTSSKILRD
jgi:hypothetical protein